MKSWRSGGGMACSSPVRSVVAMEPVPMGNVAWMVAAMRARAVCSAKASVPGRPGLRMVMGVSAWAVAPSPAK